MFKALGVGKTSIISRYINNVFQSNSLPTDGASFATKNMYVADHDKNIKFDVYIGKIKDQIWDTAGQEKFRALTKLFYKGIKLSVTILDAAVAILVYDITRKLSFDEVTNYWINQLRENAGKDISILLLLISSLTQLLLLLQTNQICMNMKKLKNKMVKNLQR